MIPAFDEFGYLPPGIHPATLDEIDARFGGLSELRRVQMKSLISPLSAPAHLTNVFMTCSLPTGRAGPKEWSR